MKAIIFGANGQDGFYLSRLLEKEGYTVTGIGRPADASGKGIVSYEDVSRLILQHRPAYIFHFAANSTTKHEALFENHATISTGTLNILEAVKNHLPSAKVFISGSGLQFKNEGRPIKETDPFEARDAYSVSRIQSVYAARYYRSLGIKAYVGYFFNHDSPLRSERHVAKKISAAAKRIAAGSNEQLTIGDMSVVKEWTFAGDIVQGVWKFIHQDAIMEANISSGYGHSIREWAETCFSVVGKNYRDHIIEEQDFYAAYQQLVSDASLIRSIGFTPTTGLKQLAEMMMSDEGW